MSEPPQEHRDIREQLGVYALGHGTAAERAAVRAHLDGCAACRAELAELSPLAPRLAGLDPDRLDETPAPPPGLREAVLARIAAEERARPARRPSRRRTALVAAAAAAGIAAAGFGVGWLTRPVPTPVPLEVVAVEVTEAGIEASAALVPHTWGVEVKLSGEGFTAGEVYRVAVTEQDGGVVPAGSFLGVGPVELHCNLNSSVLREDASGFSVIDADGAVVLRSRF
ncbi:anti-sigma factor family protein [Blastococcus sp. VKM Ac-2987]|uniref:anti-sigma factor family protein n=1 Tax=Blastococcus sp. VKM Ac-2987 TaxID=3004141 RepID=UPI0022ABA5A8|nr:zf-HC2 domain-containing protein [Blastococcus sp. VKM Ac-2987]MCZ2861037.1 zf-HC2 domain-containing protein [Blastococcus sp. VKM Ac-2987]